MRLVRWRGSDAPVTGRLTEHGRAAPIAGTVLANASAATREPGWIAPAIADEVELDGVEPLAPIEPPPSFRDFYAFEQHVATARARRGLEMEPTWYRLPVFYFSNPAVIVGDGAVIARPPRCQQLDYELELGWVVGHDLRGSDIARSAAAIVGYTVLNDWSARDIQREEMALNLGPAKGKDFATSVGPCLITADELDASTGAMTANVNGVQWSVGELADMWWSPAEMTSFAAEASVVRAGDLFGSGTCGTGCILELSLVHGADAYPFLADGDEVTLEIEGIGRLTNTVGPAVTDAWVPDAARERPQQQQQQRD